MRETLLTISLRSGMSWVSSSDSKDEHHNQLLPFVHKISHREQMCRIFSKPIISCQPHDNVYGLLPEAWSRLCVTASFAFLWQWTTSKKIESWREIGHTFILATLTAESCDWGRYGVWVWERFTLWWCTSETGSENLIHNGRTCNALIHSRRTVSDWEDLLTH